MKKRKPIKAVKPTKTKSGLKVAKSKMYSPSMQNTDTGYGDTFGVTTRK